MSGEAQLRNDMFLLRKNVISASRVIYFLRKCDITRLRRE